jgi:hypothetical protein
MGWSAARINTAAGDEGVDFFPRFYSILLERRVYNFICI